MAVAHKLACIDEWADDRTANQPVVDIALCSVAGCHGHGLLAAGVMPHSLLYGNLGNIYNPQSGP